MISSSIMSFAEEFKRYLPPGTESGPLKASHLLSKMVCQDPQPNCWLSRCDDCSKLADILNAEITDTFDDMNIKEVSYQVWMSTDRVDIQEVCTDVQKYTDKLIDELQKLKRYQFIR